LCTFHFVQAQCSLWYGEISAQSTQSIFTTSQLKLIFIAMTPAVMLRAGSWYHWQPIVIILSRVMDAMT